MESLASFNRRFALLCGLDPGPEPEPEPEPEPPTSTLATDDGAEMDSTSDLQSLPPGTTGELCEGSSESDSISYLQSFSPQDVTATFPEEIWEQIIPDLIDVAAPCACFNATNNLSKHVDENSFHPESRNLLVPKAADSCINPDEHKSGLRHIFMLSQTCQAFNRLTKELRFRHLRVRSFRTQDEGYLLRYEKSTEQWSTDFAVAHAHVLNMLHPTSSLQTQANQYVTSLNFDAPYHVAEGRARTQEVKVLANRFVKLLTHLPNLDKLVFAVPAERKCNKIFRKAFEKHFSLWKFRKPLQITELVIGRCNEYVLRCCPKLKTVIGYGDFGVSALPDYDAISQQRDLIRAIVSAKEQGAVAVEHFEMHCEWTASTWMAVRWLAEFVNIKTLGIRGRLARRFGGRGWIPQVLDARFAMMLAEFPNLTTLIFTANIGYEVLYHHPISHTRGGPDDETDVVEVPYNLYYAETSPYYMDLIHDHFDIGYLDVTNDVYDRVYLMLMNVLMRPVSEGKPTSKLKAIWIDSSPGLDDGKLRCQDYGYYDYAELRDVKLTFEDGTTTIDRQNVRRQLTDGLVPVIGFPRRTYPPAGQGMSVGHMRNPDLFHLVLPSRWWGYNRGAYAYDLPHPLTFTESEADTTATSEADTDQGYDQYDAYAATCAGSEDGDQDNAGSEQGYQRYAASEVADLGEDGQGWGDCW